MRVAVMILLGLVLGCTREDSTQQAKLGRLSEFCQGTRAALDWDLRALEDGDAQQRASSIDFLLEERVYHGYTSVATCVASVPASPDDWDRCKLDRDYRCIARQVRAYRDALVKEGY